MQSCFNDQIIRFSPNEERVHSNADREFKLKPGNASTYMDSCFFLALRIKNALNLMDGHVSLFNYMHVGARAFMRLVILALKSSNWGTCSKIYLLFRSVVIGSSLRWTNEMHVYMHLYVICMLTCMSLSLIINWFSFIFDFNF